MKNYASLFLALAITIGSVFAKLPSRIQDNNLIASKLAEYLTYYLNLEVNKRDTIVLILNDQNLYFQQKVSSIQNNTFVQTEFATLEALRSNLVAAADNLTLTEADKNAIADIAADIIIESRPNSNDCDQYKAKVNTCTRKMLDDYTDKWWNPWKLLLIAWDYTDCLYLADQAHPNCVKRHIIPPYLTQTHLPVAIGLNDPSIQN